MEVKHLILLMGTFHCISCHQLPWPSYDSASSSSSHKAASNKYFHQNAYSNDGNKEEHSSTTYLDGHNSAGDNADTYSEPSLARFQQPAKMLPYFTGKLPSSSHLIPDYISPAPTKKQSFGDQLFSFFPTTDLVQSFSLPKHSLLKSIPAITESVTPMMQSSFSPVVTIEPVISVLKKHPSVMEYEPEAKQKFTGFSEILDKLSPVNSLIGISSQNLYDDTADINSERVSSESYKINMGNPVFDVLDDDAHISSISGPDLDELIFVTEEVGNTDNINKNAEIITMLPSVLQSTSYAGSIPMYSYIPNYYYMQPYPMMSNSPSNEPLSTFGTIYDSGDVLSNDPVPMNELLRPELLYGNLPLHNGMSPYYGPTVQQYPSWPSYYQEGSSNKLQGATATASASASPVSATSDSLSRSKSYITEDLKRF